MVHPAQFPLLFSSTGRPNACPATSVIISEIKLDGSSVGFIELYDGGRGSTSLDSLSVVLYDVSNAVSRAIQSLRGQSTNRYGYKWILSSVEKNNTILTLVEMGGIF